MASSPSAKVARRRSRAGSLSVESFALPNAGRTRSRSFLNSAVGAGQSGSDSESSSVVSSMNNSPIPTPESTPRLSPGELTAKANDALARLAWDPALCAAVLEDDLGDGALASLAKVLVEARVVLPLVRDQVQLEFVHNATEKDAILRGNCVATRLMSAYCSLIGRSWVVKSLRGTVKRLLRQEGAWVLDVKHMPDGTPPEQQTEMLEEGQRRLLSVATSFLQKMSKAIAQVPREIRCMAYFVWIQARTFCPDRATLLLGGFVFLRILNPALVSPEKLDGLMPPEASGSECPGLKQNCIALCRLLQNLSNNKSYSESSGLHLLNQWLSENRDPLESYLLDLATDTQLEEGKRPFNELLAAPERPRDNPNLLRVLSDEEWDVLHVALIKSKTHVMVRTTLAPVLGSPKRASPRQTPASNSLPASPVRSRSSSRFQGDDKQELAIYGDGKMRIRSSDRRGSVSAVSATSLFTATKSQPNLNVNLRHTIGGGDDAAAPVPRAVSSGGTSPSLFRSNSGSFSGTPYPRSPSSPTRITASAHRARSRTGSGAGAGTPTAGTSPASPALSAGMPSGGNLYASNERAFFQILESIPLPEPVRREQFKSSLAQLQRPMLISSGLLHEGRRLSMKLQSGQVEQLLRIATALQHREFGIRVQSCALPLLQEWFAEWLQVGQDKDVEQLVSLMVRNGFMSEKGSRTAKGYVLESGHIAEMTRLMMGSK